MLTTSYGAAWEALGLVCDDAGSLGLSTSVPAISFPSIGTVESLDPLLGVERAAHIAVVVGIIGHALQMGPGHAHGRRPLGGLLLRAFTGAGLTSGYEGERGEEKLA